MLWTVGHELWSGSVLVLSKWTYAKGSIYVMSIYLGLAHSSPPTANRDNAFTWEERSHRDH